MTYFVDIEVWQVHGGRENVRLLEAVID